MRPLLRRHRLLLRGEGEKGQDPTLIEEEALETVATETGIVLSPVDARRKVVTRVAGDEHERYGRQLKPGQRVFLVVATANRDPRKFERPDTFAVARQPNPHLTFGLGPHFCLGAPLARPEGQIAFPIIRRRLPGLALAAAPEELEWQPVLLSRALVHLPVRVGNVLPA